MTLGNDSCEHTYHTHLTMCAIMYKRNVLFCGISSVLSIWRQYTLAVWHLQRIFHPYFIRGCDYGFSVTIRRLLDLSLAPLEDTATMKCKFSCKQKGLCWHVVWEPKWKGYSVCRSVGSVKWLHSIDLCAFSAHMYDDVPWNCTFSISSFWSQNICIISRSSGPMQTSFGGKPPKSCYANKHTNTISLLFTE